jgi:hypothetical protein
MPCQSNPPSLNHFNYVWGLVQFINLLIMQFASDEFKFKKNDSKGAEALPCLFKKYVLPTDLLTFRTIHVSRLSASI